MDNFMIRFFLCNILIGVIIALLLCAKRMLKNILTSRMQYQVWFLLLGLLAVPFLPVSSVSCLPSFAWLFQFPKTPVSPTGNFAAETAAAHSIGDTGWMNDFGIAITRHAPVVRVPLHCNFTVMLCPCSPWNRESLPPINRTFPGTERITGTTIGMPTRLWRPPCKIL